MILAILDSFSVLLKAGWVTLKCVGLVGAV